MTWLGVAQAAETPWYDFHPVVWGGILALALGFIMSGRSKVSATIQKASTDGKEAPAFLRSCRFVLGVAEHLVGASMAVVFAFWYLEWPHFTGKLDAAVQQEFAKFSEDQKAKNDTLRETIIDRVKDEVAFDRMAVQPSFWQSFDEEQRRQIRQALWLAESNRKPLDTELDAYDKVLMKSTGPARSDVELDRTIVVVDGSPKPSLRVSDTYSAKYHLGENTGGVPYPIGSVAKRLPDVEDAALYRVLYFKVNGKEIVPPVPEFFSTGPEDAEVAIQYSGSIPTGEDRSLFLEWKAESLIPFDDYLAVRVAFPTHGVRIDLQYDETRFDPKLYLFGVGVGPEPRIPGKKLEAGWIRWTSDAWLLPQHGWVLELFPRRQNGPAAPSVPAMPAEGK